MKALLTLFHFNVQYVTGDINRYHRYCSEAITPFLQTVLRNPHWRVSVEMAGSGLEFLNDHYPRTIRLLRDLIEGERIELISSTYTPSLWVAFPRKDLLSSIELNRTCLQRLGLPASRVFFAQEAFFGPAVGTLGAFFDVSLCKDDYLTYFASFKHTAPLYSLGRMPVIVGEGHLLNELGARCRSSRWCGPALTEWHRQRLGGARRRRSPKGPPAPVHAYGETAWRWYHMGSGHHFCTCFSPEDASRFFCDPLWLASNEYVLNSFSDEGFRLATVTEFFNAVRQYPPIPLPPLLEGSWNSKNSRGVLAWMGQERNAWEDIPGLLALAWRAGAALRRLEQGTGDGARNNAELDKSVAEAWRIQLFAECSDPFGWRPTPGETRFGFEAAEQALRAVASLREVYEGPPSAEMILQYAVNRPLTRPNRPLVFGPAPRFFGARGAKSFLILDQDRAVWDLQFTSLEAHCGVEFAASVEELIYCPSAMESEVFRIPLRDLRPRIVCVPLTNGLIGVGDGVYLIRDNALGYVAARLDRVKRVVSFGIDRPTKGKEYSWRFFVVRGRVEDAIGFANRINCV